MTMKLLAAPLMTLMFAALPAHAAEESATLAKIAERGEITVGHRDGAVPFSYYDDQQKPIGYAMDICARVVDAVKAKLGKPDLKVSYMPVTGTTRIPLLVNGTIDMECGTTTNNAERQKQVAFTNTHFLTASRYVFKKSSGLKSIDDLKGKTVVSTAGTTNIKQLTEASAARNLNINIIPVSYTHLTLPTIYSV